jgi:hypothetical protein
MFGLFGKPSKPVNTAQLGVAFDEIAQHCPAGAYMFARAIGIGVIILTAGQHPSWLRKRMLEDFGDDGAKTFGVDKGTTMMAAQALHKIAKAQTEGFKAFGVDDVVTRIVAMGEGYRQLSANDHSPPANDVDRIFLDHVDCKTVAEWVAKIELATTESTAERKEEVDKALACFDMFDEQRSRDLVKHLSNIDAWVKS